MKKIKFLLMIILPLFFANVVSNNVHADVIDVVKKTELTNCYIGNPVGEGLLNSSVNVKGFLHIDSIFKDNSDGEVRLPNEKYQNDIDDANLSCQQLIMGYEGSGGKWEAIVPGIKEDMSEAEAKIALTNLGYKPKSPQNRRCVYFRYNAGDDDQTQTDSKYTKEVCVSGIDTANKFTSSSEIDVKSSFLAEDLVGSVNFNYANGDNPELYIECSSGLANKDKFSATVGLKEGNSWVTWDAFKYSIYNILSRGGGEDYPCNTYTVNGGTLTQNGYVFTPESSYSLGLSDDNILEESGEDDGEWVFADNQASSALKYVLRNNLGWNSGGDLVFKFTEQEKSNLYKWYFANFYKAELICKGDEKFSTLPANDENVVKTKDVGGKECYAKVGQNRDEKVNGITPSLTWSQELDFDHLIQEMSEEDLATAEEVAISDPEDDPSSAENTCADSGAAGALGWIVCPILEWMGNASQWLYDDFLEPSLQIDSSLFSQTPAVYDAWNIFRNIANTVFIVLVLVIIFSQLTGFGIDNYGIKKALPKVVVVAVLVNLSFILCEACVDLSNILGNGFQKMFNSIHTDSTSLTIDAGTNTSMDGNSTILTVGESDPETGGVAVSTDSGDGTAPTLVSVAVLAVLVTVAVLNPAVLLSLLVSAIGVIVSVFFLFILLAARQAGVIILVVASPVAIVCYALPNTKSIFDKWLKLGEGLLMVYPIAGLLVGGGNFVARLLLSSGFAERGFITALVAMIIGIVPIFFIPSVLKGAFAAMGNIGAKISGLGAKMSGMTTNKIRSTDTYQNLQKMGKDRQKRITAGAKKDGSLNRLGKIKSRVANSKFGRVTGYKNTYTNNLSDVQKTMEEDKQRGADLTNTVAQNAIDSEYGGDAEAYYTDMINKAGVRGDLNGVESAYKAAVDSGYFRPGQLAKMARDNIANSNIQFRDNAQRSSFFRNFASKNGDIVKKDGEMRAWMQAGGVTARDQHGNAVNTDLGDYGDYWKVNKPAPGAYKMDDLEAMGDESLAALMVNGGMDVGTAEQLLNSRAISSGARVLAGSYARGLMSIDNNTSAKELAGEANKLVQDPNYHSPLINADASTVESILKPKPQDVHVV